jgi:predicted MFS family arabinose efflux permease
MFTAAFESGLSLGAVVLGFVLAHGDFTRVWLTAGIVPLFGFVFFLIAGRN